jgi:alkylhydroperoxidase family enzyme
MPARKREDLPIGTELGIYTVIGPSVAKQVPGRSGQRASRHRYFVPLRCNNCSREIDVREDDLKRRAATPCGYCYAGVDTNPEDRVAVTRVWNGQVQHYDRYRFHGQSRTRLHSVWTNMRERCSNPNSEKYPRYGGRGITVCDEWRNFRAFAAWAHGNGYAEGLAIDRINNDHGYSPNNCRWVTDLENLMNRSRYLPEPLHTALEERAAVDGTDTYTVIRHALQAARDSARHAGGTR